MADSESLLGYELDTRKQLELFTQETVQEGGDPVRAITFISDSNPTDLIEDYTPSGFSLEIEEHAGFTKIDTLRRIESDRYEDNVKTFSGDIYLFSNDQDEIYTAFAVCDDDFYQYGLRRLIGRIPGISISYLDTAELRKLLEAIDDNVDGQTIVDKAVIKSPSAKTDIQYLREPYYVLFNSKKVEEEDYFVDKIQFSIRNGRDRFEGFVSRNGDTRYTAGSNGIYFNRLLRNLSNSLSEKGEIFVGKSREYGSREAKRLDIEYEPGEIQGTESNMELIEALRGLKRSSMTVYHKNPYLHASLLDYSDGSTADIFITSDKKVSIVPGFNSSRQSLSRICDQITQGFGEGEVKEGRRKSKDFDDYFSGGAEI